MQKTKLGISACLVAAAAYFLGLYSGYIITGLLVGYILLKEEDLWLRRNALRVIVLMLMFSLLGTAIYLIPNLLSLVTELLQVFNVHFTFSVIHNLFNLLSSVIDLVQRFIFISLGILALLKRNVRVPVVDAIINKYIVKQEKGA